MRPDYFRYRISDVGRNVFTFRLARHQGYEGINRLAFNVVLKTNNGCFGHAVGGANRALNFSSAD